MEWLAPFDMAFQVIASGGHTTTPSNKITEWFVLVVMHLAGLCIFSVFLGYITDNVAVYMANLAEGRSKVPLSGHVLILGWNESTVRLVCQLAFLHQQLDKLNSTFLRRYVRYFRLKGATAVADAKIVVVNDSVSSPDMVRIIRAAVRERGIKGVKVGLDILCRVGDPSSVHDLIRVGAVRARRILIMETIRDKAEFEASGGKVTNGATLRAILTLRYLFQMCPTEDTYWDTDHPLHIVAQFEQPSDCEEACNFRGAKGRSMEREIVTCMHLGPVLNSLLFNCVSTPGMANVLLELLSFEDVAMRCRIATDLPGVIGKRVDQCAFLWENSIFLGYIDPAKLNDTEAGLAPDPSHKILPTDLVLYAAPTALPTLAKALPDGG